MESRRQYWRRRHKRWTRCLARDLRDLGPLVGVFLCMVSTATAIEAIERVSIPRARGEAAPPLPIGISIFPMAGIVEPSPVASGPPPGDLGSIALEVDGEEETLQLSEGSR